MKRPFLFVVSVKYSIFAPDKKYQSLNYDAKWFKMDGWPPLHIGDTNDSPAGALARQLSTDGPAKQ
jgi:hypothetical protein